MNGVERFFIEKIRVNTEYNILGGITQAEIISFCLIITGILMSIYCIQRHKTQKINWLIFLYQIKTKKGYNTIKN